MDNTLNSRILDSVSTRKLRSKGQIPEQPVETEPKESVQLGSTQEPVPAAKLTVAGTRGKNGSTTVPPSLAKAVGTEQPLVITGPNGEPLPVKLGPDGTLQILDPQLLSILAQQAKAKNLEDPGFINPLSEIEPTKMSPVGDFLQLKPENARETLAARQPKIYDWAKQHKQYVSEFDDLTKVKIDGKVVTEDGKPKMREVPVEALRAFEARWTEEVPDPAGQKILTAVMPGPLTELGPGPKAMDAGQMTRLLEAYQDRGHFEDVSRCYEKMRSLDPDLGKYEIPREYYIVSLNKQKRIKESIRESESLINERVEEINHGAMGFIEASRRNVYRSMGINGEVLSGMGKAYKLVHEKAEAQIDERVAGADFAGLYSQLTGTKPEDWKLGDKTVAQVASDRVQARLGDQLALLANRKENPQENFNEAVSLLESTTGTKRDDWRSAPGPDLLSSFKEAKDVPAQVEAITGRPQAGWAYQIQEVKKLSSEPINKAVGKVIRGVRTPESLSETVQGLSGVKLNGALASAAESAKLNEVLESVTKRGNLDAELVARVENNSATTVGKNLLKASRKALEVSRDYYLAGFGVDGEYYPGINVVYTELMLGNHKAAKGLTPLVQYAVMREGGAESKDYWGLATQVELGAIGDQPATVHKLLPRLMDSAKVGWQLGTTADNLEMLAEKKREDGEDAGLIDFVATTFRERQKVGFPAPKDFDLGKFTAEAQKQLAQTWDVSEVPEVLTADEKVRKEITDKIHARSKDFQSVFTSKFVGGSWKFVSQGGVADRPINRQTIRALREVNKHLGFNELSSPDDFPIFHNRALTYIDTKFGLVNADTGERGMEDLESEIHHKRDRFTQNRHDAFHSRVSGTAQTNLAVEIMLGQSDCRDTDATYQAMFDLWKRDQQTALMQKAIDAVMDGHEKSLDDAFGGTKKWDQIQVVSMDLGFHAGAKLKLDENGQPIKYKIQKDDRGRMIRTDDGDLLKGEDGKPLSLEDHSMPFLLRYDEKGLVLPKEGDGMRATDPFYRHFWQLGNQPVDPAGILDQDKGFYLGQSGETATDGRPVDLYGTPTRYSGAAPQDLEGEAGQVTLGGMEVAMNDLSPLLSENNELTHLTDAIRGIVTGSSKERVLNAVMSRMLDESAMEVHQIWKRSKDREVIDPKSPFLGAGPERVVITEEASRMEYGEFKTWIQGQAPEGVEIPKWKMGALHNAKPGEVVFDPAYKSYAEMLDSGDKVRRSGEAAVAPLATALYLQDFRHSEDLSYTLDQILDGKDKQGKEELERVTRVAYLASQMVVGERGYDSEITVMENTSETRTTQGRKDFLSWHTIHANDKELAELDAYTLKPAADWLMKHLEGTSATSGRAVLDKVVGELVEEAAADAHNIGWKVSKDNALANPSDPFVGWASVRNRISSETPQVADMSRQEIADFYKLPSEQVSEEKAEAIREATRKAVAEGKQKGADITHTLYKPYSEVKGDQPDGGTRFAGANAVPLMTLALYLSDFRSSETDTLDGLKKTLAGLITGTDKDGLKDVTMLNHVAFQAAQLTYGERSYENEVPVKVNSGRTKKLEAHPMMVTVGSASPGGLQENAGKVEAATRWLNRDLERLIDQ